MLVGLQLEQIFIGSSERGLPPPPTFYFPLAGSFLSKKHNHVGFAV
jgi:hypothetical protein